MLDRSKFDSALTDKFFTTPDSSLIDELQVNFPLPPSVDNFAVFLESKNGSRFRRGIDVLLKELKNWVIENDLNAQRLKDLFLKLNSKSGNENSFLLFTSGVLRLAKILEVVKSGSVPLNVSKAIVEEMLIDFDKCDAGVYINIRNAYLKLTADVATELMMIRQTLAEQIVSEGIIEFNAQMHQTHEIDGDAAFYIINAGDEKHFNSAVSNYFSDDICVRLIADPFAAQDSDGLNFILKHFEKFVYVTMTPEKIITQILSQLDLHELKKHISGSPEKLSEYLKDFRFRLEKYGIDKDFNMNDLFDQDALADDEFKISPNAETVLKISLLQRLSSNKYIVPLRKLASIKKDNEASMYLFPDLPLEYSFVKDAGRRIPALIYFRDKFLADEYHFMQFLNEEKHKKAFIDFIPDRKWKLYLTTCSHEDLHDTLIWAPCSCRSHLLNCLDAVGLVKIINCGSALKSVLKLLPADESNEFLKQFSSALKTKSAMDKYRDDESTYIKLQNAKSVKPKFFNAKAMMKASQQLQNENVFVRFCRKLMA